MRQTIKHGNIAKHKGLKYLFFLLGLLCLFVGFTGLIFPIIPGAVFVLFSTYFFARSSGRVHRLLMHNRIFGKHLQDFADGKKIPLQTKLVGAGIMILSIVAAVYIYEAYSAEILNSSYVLYVKGLLHLI
jgi:uncharacterized membrane protein YbaN (DUF454 family)